MKPPLPCQVHDPDLWFPVGYAGPAQVQAEKAKALCAPCRIKEACLSHALETWEDIGIWGGATEEERRTMRRQQGFYGRKYAHPKKSTVLAGALASGSGQ